MMDPSEQVTDGAYTRAPISAGRLSSREIQKEKSAIENELKLQESSLMELQLAVANLADRLRPIRSERPQDCEAVGGHDQIGCSPFYYNVWNSNVNIHQVTSQIHELSRELEV